MKHLRLFICRTLCATKKENENMKQEFEGFDFTNFWDDLSSTYKCNFLGADNKQ